MLSIAAANRDPAVYSNPDELNLRRGGPPHVSFGQGIHFCLGSALARLELKVALQALLRHIPSFKADPSEAIEWKPALAHRGVKELHLILSKSAHQ